MEFIKIILTAIFSVVSIFIITKIMGHKQVAQLDFFDYISGITIGSIAAELATDIEAPWKSLTALIVYGLVSVGLEILTHKFPRTRKYINGTPTIVMSGGKIYRENLKKSKLDLSEFLLLCREQGYFDIDEISVAIFEQNGKLSVLPKAANRPTTPSDLGIQVKALHIGIEVIMDGRIMGENLARMNKDEKWIKNQLRIRGYKDERAVFFGIYHEEEDTLSLYPNE